MKKRPGQKRKRVEATADNSDRNGRTKEAEAAADGDRQRYRGGNMITRSVHTSFSPHQFTFPSIHDITLPAVHDISSHFLQSTTSVYTSFSPRHQFTLPSVHDISSHFNPRLTTSLRTAPCCNTRLHPAMFHWMFPHVATTRLTGRVERQVPSAQRGGRGKNQSIRIEEKSIFTSSSAIQQTETASTQKTGGWTGVMLKCVREWVGRG